MKPDYLRKTARTKRTLKGAARRSAINRKRREYSAYRAMLAQIDN